MGHWSDPVPGRMVRDWLGRERPDHIAAENSKWEISSTITPGMYRIDQKDNGDVLLVSEAELFSLAMLLAQISSGKIEESIRQNRAAAGINE